MKNVRKKRMLDKNRNALLTCQSIPIPVNNTTTSREIERNPKANN